MRIEVRNDRQQNEPTSTNLILPKYTASKLLSQIHFDHFYSSNNLETGETVAASDGNPADKVSVITPSTSGYNSQGRPRNDTDFSSLDADDIQMVFQEMLNMTMLMPIQCQPLESFEECNSEPSTSAFKKVTIVDNLSSFPKPSTSQFLEFKPLDCVKSSYSDVQTHKPLVSMSMDKTSVSQNASTYTVPGKDKDVTLTQVQPKIAALGAKDSLPSSTPPKVKKIRKIAKQRSKMDKTLKIVPAIYNKKVDMVNSVKRNAILGQEGNNEMSAKETFIDSVKNSIATCNPLRGNAVCRSAEPEMAAQLNYAGALLVQKWAEYLVMTRHEVAACEARVRREDGWTPEVVDMLEDTSRYVWQLVDELKFYF